MEDELELQFNIFFGNISFCFLFKRNYRECVLFLAGFQQWEVQECGASCGGE